MLHRDFLIVGQGLAGSALAWTLRWAGASVLVVDRETPSSSSRVAAGLMTCITGPRLVKSWRWDELWPFAVDFYRRVEATCGVPLLQTGPMVRLLTTDAEVEFLERRRDTDLKGLIVEAAPLIDERWFAPARGGFEILPGGRLDVPRYLAETRRMLDATADYVAGDLRLPDDLTVTTTDIEVPRLGAKVGTVILCQGIDAIENPWFADLRFNPTRGEMVTVDIPGLDEDRVVHDGSWLARIEGTRYRFGATYDWNDLFRGPTPAGRAELTRRLRTRLRVPFEIVAHDAAVRPILHQLPPALGRLPGRPRVAAFNGLGSKGTLQAPYFARQLAEHLLTARPIERELNLAVRMQHP